MKPKEITLGGIMVALTSIILYSTSLIPINTLTILTIASAIIPVCIIRSNIKTAIFVYIASSIMAFLLVPINISILYILFFGVYGMIKYFAEKTKSRNREILYKLIFFNIVFIISFIIFQQILGINVISGIEVIISRFLVEGVKITSFVTLVIMAQAIFLLFDYALTLIITFYMERIHKKNK